MGHGTQFGSQHAVDEIHLDQMLIGLFAEWSGDRKKTISRLVNFFIANIAPTTNDEFEHPLLRYRAAHPENIRKFLQGLKDATLKLVVKDARVQQLEWRGQRVVDSLFKELSICPEDLIPGNAWNDLDPNDSESRRVCDYIAGMTDPYAQRIYQRLFTPGFGSSYDEI